MLFADSPIGKIQIPEWQEKELLAHSDEELLARAILQHKKFCISPAVFAMVEKRGLSFRLQKLINPNIGRPYYTLDSKLIWEVII